MKISKQFFVNSNQYRRSTGSLLVIALVAVIGLLASCDNGNEPDNSGGTSLPPEERPDEERWWSWSDPSSTATITHSVAEDGVCTIVVRGAPDDAWSAWKAMAGYNYTTTAEKSYKYTFEAWTVSGTRDLLVNYYEDINDQVWLSETVLITTTRTTFTVYGQDLPKSGENALRFHSADQTGTYYVKILSINKSSDGSDTNPTTYTVTVNGGSGSGSYTSGSTVYISAIVPSGQKFQNWTGNVVFTNANIPSTTFTMPANAVIVTANFSSDGFNEADGIANIGRIGPGGGKIFYYSDVGFTMTDNNQVCHYLEAAPNDINMSATLEWASSSFTFYEITGTDTTIGTGRKNTALILATDIYAPAAKACKDLISGSKTDWFLPSKDELNELYKNRNYVSNLIPTDIARYWSSSEYSSYEAWGQQFGNGIQVVYSKYLDNFFSVRAVRAF